MAEAEYDYNDFDRTSQQRQDDTLAVKFFVKPKEDKTASAEAGRPIFKDVEYIDIRTPGSRDGVQRPARQRDINRFPRHYQAFKNRIEGDGELPVEGTLLIEWPLVTRSNCEELAFFHVTTVEQLAGMSDSNTAQSMGLGKLKRKAQEWLAMAKEQKGSIELHEELAVRDVQLADMQKELAELKATMKPKTKRKRRTKEEMEQDSVDDSDASGNS